MTLYLDIETIGDDPHRLDHDVRAHLARDLGDPDAADGDGLDRLALSPFTGSIVVCAVWDTDKAGGACFAIVDDEEHAIMPGFRLVPCDDEADMVSAVWKTIGARQRIATWNGDEFDVPFLVARAAVHGVVVPRWVIDAKPWEGRVVDVMKKLAPDRRMRPTLEVACRAFGVPSPKSDLSGPEVGAAWSAGRRLDVARYCCADVRALAEIGERYFWTTDERPLSTTVGRATGAA